MAVELVGRGDEMATLHAVLDAVGTGPAAVVLEGEPGIGKTTLWLAAVEAARERSLRVLSARPVEAERELAYVGLADLLESDLDDVLAELPAPRRRAVESALLLEGDGGAGTDPRTLGAAVHSTLRLLAARGPLVVAVDDVQWLDTPSAAALAFALRRLEREPVATLLARRAAVAAPSALDAVLPDARRIAVGPLTIGALQGLVRARLGRPLPRPTLVRVHEASGGNPFYALELGRAVLAEGVSLDPAAPFPFPASLQELLGGRLARLPEDTRRALLAVAALGSPTETEAEAAGVDAEALAPAVAAGVLEDGSPLRFSHPLLASELEAGAPPDERRAVHRRLAGVVADPVGRARQLALALEEPDAAAAAELEAAAAVARMRGAPSVAAELDEASARATPPPDADARHRRALQAARDHLAAGAAERAFVVAREALDGARAERERAEALLVLGDLEDAAGDQVAALADYRDALADAAGVPDLELLLHERLALNTRITEGLVPAERHAREAVRLAGELQDDGLASRALAALATVRCNSGGADTLDLAQRALDLGLQAGDRATIDDARIAYAHCHAWTYRLDEARRVLLEVEESAAEHDEPMLSNAFWYLATVEERAGRLAAARGYAERAHEIAVEYGGPQRRDEPTVLGARARVAALQGEEAEARELIDRGLASVEAAPPLSTSRYLRHTLGVVDHWAGENERALESFVQADAERRAAGFSYRMAPYVGDYVETLLELGRHDEAAALIDDWEAGLAELGQDWGLAEAVRSRGLLAAARGELDEAEALLERAVDAHEVVGDPFGRGRALLALGVVRRRLRRKRPAREAIEAALRVFEGMGAAGWAAKARAELGRVGGRTRIDGLSPAEQRVAALVAEGRTNKEVAAALFLGERTVETHLTRIYAKLGVRSRSQLARTLR